MDIELLEACESGDLPAVNAAITRGASVNTRGLSELPALSVAASRGHAAVVDVLLTCGGAGLVDGRDRHGETALHKAAFSGHVKVIKTLMDKGGAAVDTRTRGGETPLMLAASAGQLEAVKFLLERNADINAQDHNQKTALLRALDNQRDSVVEVLKEAFL